MRLILHGIVHALDDQTWEDCDRDKGSLTFVVLSKCARENRRQRRILVRHKIRKVSNPLVFRSLYAVSLKPPKLLNSSSTHGVDLRTESLGTACTRYVLPGPR